MSAVTGIFVLSKKNKTFIVVIKAMLFVMDVGVCNLVLVLYGINLEHLCVHFLNLKEILQIKSQMHQNPGGKR